MKRSIGRIAVILTVITALFAFTLPVNAEGYYIHDPMKNPKAAADIVVDPDAVYGYAPNPDSERLGFYAEFDWSDESYVEEMRQERLAYHDSLRELYQIKADMDAQGCSVEEIARAVSTRRNELRMAFYENDPERLAKFKQSNLETYGNENGGTPEYFYAKYGSWETVIEKAFSTNAGADACVGLYDLYYFTYVIPPTEENSPATPDEAAPAAATPDETGGSNATKSPLTGDDAALPILLILLMSGLAAVSVKALKDDKKRSVTEYRR